PYTENITRNYNYRANIEPHGSLRIELNGNYNKQQSITEYIVFDDNLNRFNYNVSPNETGNFNITTVTLLRSFRDGNDPVESKLFDEFIGDRFNMARELGAQRNIGVTQVAGADYVDGYSLNQQDVLMGS